LCSCALLNALGDHHNCFSSFLIRHIRSIQQFWKFAGGAITLFSVS